LSAVFRVQVAGRGEGLRLEGVWLRVRRFGADGRGLRRRECEGAKGARGREACRIWGFIHRRGLGEAVDGDSRVVDHLSVVLLGGHGAHDGVLARGIKGRAGRGGVHSKGR
jgi:hypothetical protein